MRYELVAPIALHQHWPFIKAGLERTREVCGERWLAEDVFTHLRIGKAQCYLGFDDLHCRGFFVVENRNDQFTNEPYLSVWVLYAVPTNGEHFADVGPFMGETIGFIDGLARQISAKWIAMEGRKGWERYLKDYFMPTKTKYERTVDHGR